MKLSILTKNIGPHSYGAVLLPFPPEWAKQFTDFALLEIPDFYLAEEGREFSPHVTISFGFEDSGPDTVRELRKYLTGYGPIKIRFDKISLFPDSGDGDVLKVDVSGQDLHDLHWWMRDNFEVVDKFEDYKPHATIAYINPSYSHLYDGIDAPFLGKEITIDVAEWSGANGSREYINLTAPLFSLNNKALPTPPPAPEPLKPTKPPSTPKQETSEFAKPPEPPKLPQEPKPGERIPGSWDRYEPEQEPSMHDWIANATQEYSGHPKIHQNTGFLLQDGKPAHLDHPPEEEDYGSNEQIEGEDYGEEDHPPEMGHHQIAPSQEAMKRWGWDESELTGNPEEGYAGDFEVDMMLRRSRAARIRSFNIKRQFDVESPHNPLTEAQIDAVVDHVLRHKPKRIGIDVAGVFQSYTPKDFIENYNSVRNHMLGRGKTTFLGGFKSLPKQTKNPVIAVDLDGTLAEYDGWKGEDHIGAPRLLARESMQKLKQAGYKIIIWTVRGNTQRVEGWLRQNLIPYDHINYNNKQPRGSSGKVAADIYIDDRAVPANNPWPVILRDVETLLAEQRGKNGQDSIFGRKFYGPLSPYKGLPASCKALPPTPARSTPPAAPETPPHANKPPLPVTAPPPQPKFTPERSQVTPPQTKPSRFSEPPKPKLVPSTIRQREVKPQEPTVHFAPWTDDRSPKMTQVPPIPEVEPGEIDDGSIDLVVPEGMSGSVPKGVRTRRANPIEALTNEQRSGSAQGTEDWAPPSTDIRGTPDAKIDHPSGMGEDAPTNPNPFDPVSDEGKLHGQLMYLIDQSKAGEVHPNKLRNKIDKLASPYGMGVLRDVVANLAESGIVPDWTKYTPGRLADYLSESVARPNWKPGPPPKPSRSATARPLQTAKVIGRKPLDFEKNVNAAEIVTLEDGSKGVFKAESGEASGGRPSVKGRYHAREAMAYEVAELLGLEHLVPPTAVRDIEGDKGSIQQFVKGSSPASKVGMWDRYDGDEDLGKAAAFDYLIGNLDRHDGNWMVKKDGTIMLIDHGLSFPEDNNWYGYRHQDIQHKKVDRVQLMSQAAKRNLVVPEFVQDWVGRWGEIEERMREGGFTEGEIRSTGERLTKLATVPTFKHVMELARTQPQP